MYIHYAIHFHKVVSTNKYLTLVLSEILISANTKQVMQINEAH